MSCELTLSRQLFKSKIAFYNRIIIFLRSYFQKICRELCPRALLFYTTGRIPFFIGTRKLKVPFGNRGRLELVAIDLQYYIAEGFLSLPSLLLTVIFKYVNDSSGSFGIFFEMLRILFLIPLSYESSEENKKFNFIDLQVNLFNTFILA